VSSTHKAALAAISRVVEEFRRGVDREDRHHLVKIARDAIALLEQGAEHRRLSTAALVERVRHLEHLLADRPSAERTRIIRQRLGLGRSAFYRIRKISRKSH
jgi:hypothetical protein